MGKIIEMKKKINSLGPCWYNARSWGFGRNASGEMSHYIL